MTILELHDKIESGEITVDYGIAFMDLKDPKEHLLSKIKEMHDWAMKCLDIDYGGNRDIRDIYFYNDNNIVRAVVEGISLHSWLTPERLFLHLKDNHITFKQLELQEDFSHKYIDPQLPKHMIMQAECEITVPSRELVFVNFYPDEVNKEPPNKYDNEFSLNHIMGRYNLTKYYAEKNNIAFGQMSNISISVWSNGDEIIISDGILEHPEEACEENLPDEDSQYYESSLKEYKQTVNLLQYFKENNFKMLGDISCGVWRWECADSKIYESCKSDEVFERQDKPIRVLINGDRVKVEHFFGTCAEYPDDMLIYSRIKIIN